MSKWRIVRGAEGRCYVRIEAHKCKYLYAVGDPCGEPVRKEPGAVYCQKHRDLENAGCAEHDKLNCPECGS